MKPCFDFRLSGDTRIGSITNGQQQAENKRMDRTQGRFGGSTAHMVCLQTGMYTSMR